MRNLNDDLARTYQGYHEPEQDSDAPLVPKAAQDCGAIDHKVRNVTLTDRARRLRNGARRPLGACVTAELLGGKG